MTASKVSLLCVLPEAWRDYYLDGFRKRLPDVQLVLPQDAIPPESITYAFVLAPPPGYLARFPRLKAIMPVGAGVEHILADPDLPDVPVVRMVQPDMAQRMSEYIVQHVLNHMRRYREIREAQARQAWNLFVSPTAQDTTVGILGLGTLGQHAATYLRPLGFKVRGWSRTPKSVQGVECFVGDDSLPEFLSGCDVLVSLLPLTPETAQLIDAQALKCLPRGASLINASRGGIIKDADLIASLDNGEVSEATLDAFDIEPLPEDYPYWTHPRVTVTPHCASAATVEAVADRLREVITQVERGGMPSPVVDRTTGY
ncbi:glyoxylate/hydroxypyruvate reductase A [uncultured Hyphomonas sp.]|uniref:2-hydroxyacid dehydrogenase n=1 Tax=uncultured Hyphomonas sp. TaxID=225298 RepID=UPI002AAB62D3|nr:glyoxylate/hydroxypyruvate reductase A [uncultured Hyphomonas sp.]